MDSISAMLGGLIALIIFNLSTTLSLYKKINKLCERIAKIETTLKIFDE